MPRHDDFDDDNNIGAANNQTTIHPRRRFHAFLGLLGVFFLGLPATLWTAFSSELSFAQVFDFLSGLNENQLSITMLVVGGGLIAAMLVGMIGRKVATIFLLSFNLVLGLALAYMLVSAV